MACGTPGRGSAISSARRMRWKTSLLSRRGTKRVQQGHTFPPRFLSRQACSAMCLVGILFIIFPLNLINPRSVMNLEIPIKHIITDQRRAGGGWQGLLTATQGVWLCRAVLSEPGSWGWVGLGSGPGAPPLPGKVKSDPWGCRPLGVMFTSLAHRAGDSTWPRPPAGLGGMGWVRIPPPSQEDAVSRLVWVT